MKCGRQTVKFWILPNVSGHYNPEDSNLHERVCFLQLVLTSVTADFFVISATGSSTVSDCDSDGGGGGGTSGLSLRGARGVIFSKSSCVIIVTVL